MTYGSGGYDQPNNGPGYGGTPPPSWGYPQPGYPQPFQQGYPQLGQIRGTGISFLLFVVTFGIYGYVYNYSVHEEMKRHTGQGIGGGIALVLTLFAGIAMPFVTPNEVGNMYFAQGKAKPVSAKTGVWAVLPFLIGLTIFIATYVTIFTTATYHDSTDDYGNPTTSPEFHGGQIAGLIAAPVLMFALAWGGQIYAFAKTNRALNDYWSSLGVSR